MLTNIFLFISVSLLLRLLFFGVFDFKSSDRMRIWRPAHEQVTYSIPALPQNK